MITKIGILVLLPIEASTNPNTIVVGIRHFGCVLVSKGSSGHFGEQRQLLFCNLRLFDEKRIPTLIIVPPFLEDPILKRL